MYLAAVTDLRNSSRHEAIDHGCCVCTAADQQSETIASTVQLAITPSTVDVAEKQTRNAATSGVLRI